MRFPYLSAGLLRILTILCIIAGSTFLVYVAQHTESEVSHLPRLIVDGNTIQREDTRQPVLLRGVVSDYFRFGHFNQGIQSRGLEAEFTLLNKVSNAGVNLVGLYVADSETLLAHVAELDAYIEHAKQLGMYVYLMPVAREFNGKKDASDGSRQESPTELEQLIDALSVRYGQYPHVLFGFGAEPEDEAFKTWDTLQQRLAMRVRTNAPQSIILVTGYVYAHGLDPYVEHPFPYQNVVYVGGGYIAADDADATAHPEMVIRRLDELPMKALAARHPYLVGEFGGNYGADFSSAADLTLIAEILVTLHAQNAHYTMYKLSANDSDDGLSLYSTSGKITPRGTHFLRSLKQSLPTRFWQI